LNLFKTISTYGQFFLDEFNSEEFKKEGWWSKKYAWQLGAKYLDVFKIKNLDFQLEFNRARPFMYTHFTTYTNYVNYNLPIAHPLGANFKEMVMDVRYQPLPKLFLRIRHFNALRGEDIDDKNFGVNLKTNNRENRNSDYNNFIGQGFENKIKFWEYSASYMLKHNLFVDASYSTRKDSFHLNTNEKTFGIGLRLNFNRQTALL
jgi:hypothetical protein